MYNFFQINKIDWHYHNYEHLENIGKDNFIFIILIKIRFKIALTCILSSMKG